MSKKPATVDEAPLLSEHEQTKARAEASREALAAQVAEREALITSTEADIAALQEQAQQEDAQAEDWRAEVETMRQQITSARVLLEINPKQAARDGLTLERIAEQEAQRAALVAQLTRWDDSAYEREATRARNRQTLQEQLAAHQAALADWQLQAETLDQAIRDAHTAIGREKLERLKAELAEEQDELAALLRSAQQKETHLAVLRSWVARNLADWPELEEELLALLPARQQTTKERLLQTFLAWLDALLALEEGYDLALMLEPTVSGLRLFPLVQLNEHELRALFWQGQGNQADQRVMIRQKRSLAGLLLTSWELTAEREYQERQRRRIRGGW